MFLKFVYNFFVLDVAFNIFFLNFSIGVEPLLPNLCIHNQKKIQNSRQKPSESDTINKNLKDLTITMNTLSCGLNLNDENICMLPLLMSLVNKNKI